MNIFSTLKFISAHPLSSQNRVAALKRYFGWQLGSRLLPFPVAVPFVQGTFLVAERGMTGATGNIYCGLHEFNDMGFLLHFLRSEDIFVDVGANIGSYSVLAAGVVKAKVISLEPLPGTFAKLQRNLRYNELETLVEAHCCAAGAGSAELNFSADRDTMNQVVADNYPGKSIKVPVRPLDEILEGKMAVMWKVDVEGFEPEVMAGAQSVLRQASLQAVLLEGQQPEVEAAMQAAGFSRAHYEPLQRSLRPASRDEPGGQNALWIRDFAFVEERCRTARAVTVAGVSF
jgi:FkbM family methyltransferase